MEEITINVTASMIKKGAPHDMDTRKCIGALTLAKAIKKGFCSSFGITEDHYFSWGVISGSIHLNSVHDYVNIADVRSLSPKGVPVDMMEIVTPMTVILKGTIE